MVNRRTALKTIGLATASAVAGAVAVGVSHDESEADSVSATNTELYPFWGRHQAGIITPQPPAVLLVSLEVLSSDRSQLIALFKTLSGRVQTLMAGQFGSAGDTNENFPPQNSGELGFGEFKTGQLSIMTGLGASLFTTESGQNRFGLAAYKPIALKPMPTDLVGDRLDPNWLGGDLFLQISSDDPLINLHVLRDILRFTKGQLKPLWAQPGFQRFVTEPAGEATARGLFGFKDGTSNLDPANPELLTQLVWTGAEEPDWARGGTYLAVRIIREQLERWDLLSLAQQEASIGRRKQSGAVLGGTTSTQSPNYTLDPDGRQVPLDSHIRKANPRLGAESDKHRILRRGYLYFNGIDKNGLLDAGFLFMGFCRNLEAQFEYVKRQYMNNRDFPKPETGRPSLDQHMTAIGGGYFFVLPGVPGEGRFLGDSLLLG